MPAKRWSGCWTPATGDDDRGLTLSVGFSVWITDDDIEFHRPLLWFDAGISAAADGALRLSGAGDTCFGRVKPAYGASRLDLYILVTQPLSEIGLNKAHGQ
jgi:hypothetical protein